MIIVERSGKPLVAMIPVDVYNRLIAEREERFQAVDRLRDEAPEVPEAEVEEDVDEAIKAVRDADAS